METIPSGDLQCRSDVIRVDVRRPVDRSDGTVYPTGEDGNVTQ